MYTVYAVWIYKHLWTLWILSVSSSSVCEVLCRNEHVYSSWELIPSPITGVTFSGSEGLSGCQPCSQCPLGVPQLERCTITQDTHCDCGKGFFLWKRTNETDALCAPCATCGRGEGVVRACGPAGNTVCQPCGLGTFSEDKSYSQTCMPCSRCREDEVEIRPCQAKSDTLCMGGYMILKLELIRSIWTNNYN